MTVAVVVLSLVIGTLAGGMIWMARSTSSRVDQLLAASDMLSKTRDELGQQTLAVAEAKFETATTKTALASESARASALEEFVAADAKQESNATASLARDDVAGRVALLSARWGAVSISASAGDQVPAVPGTAAVRDIGATAPPTVADVPKSGS